MKYANYILTLFMLGSFMACDVEEEEPAPITGDDPTFVINSATNVTTSSADISGTVTGENLVDVGFVFGTTSNLTENSDKLSQGTKAMTMSTTLSGLNDNTNYYYGAYAVDADGEFFRSEVKMFTTDEQTVLKLGDSYEGGIIYYLDFSGEHGLLVTPTDVTMDANWQTAYDECYNLILAGNDKWRLPNLDELEDLYDRRGNVPNLASIAYWSRSVEGSNPSLAYGVFFGNGTNAGKSFVYNKTDNFQHSRAIRDF